MRDSDDVPGGEQWVIVTFVAVTHIFLPKKIKRKKLAEGTMV